MPIPLPELPENWGEPDFDATVPDLRRAVLRYQTALSECSEARAALLQVLETTRAIVAGEQKEQDDEP